MKNEICHCDDGDVKWNVVIYSPESIAVEMIVMFGQDPLTRRHCHDDDVFTW